jgi:hypothetical protein
VQQSSLGPGVYEGRLGVSSLVAYVAKSWLLATLWRLRRKHWPSRLSTSRRLLRSLILLVDAAFTPLAMARKTVQAESFVLHRGCHLVCKPMRLVSSLCTALFNNILT